MFAVERFDHSVMEGAGLKIVREHRRPSHGLQQSPVRAEREGKRNGDDDFTEPNEHDETVEYRQVKVKTGYDRALRVSECWMAPLPVKKAPARRRKDFPAVTNACAAASARSSRRPPRWLPSGIGSAAPARGPTHAVSHIACRFPPPIPDRSIFITSVIW